MAVRLLGKSIPTMMSKMIGRKSHSSISGSLKLSLDALPRRTGNFSDPKRLYILFILEIMAITLIAVIFGGMC